ncbi:Hsp70 family protein [Rhodococcus zopfii]|uniref:Hsp70 family protein n=1 Tax=Rhodococcus zopfii TaxID=43772 RepID=A0ABU3WT09_9NOCA|nr:Hsp70 family protein [Rhodococcus zopfii]
MSWVLAIDFGTSNTSAAHRIGPDRVESLPLTHTSNLMPSAVYVDPHGTVSTGEVAVNRATVDPAGYVAAPKAHVAAGTVPVRGHHLPVAAAIAAVLRTVHTRALQAHNNQAPAAVVLTHPEAWSGRELAVLREAATSAGLGGHVSLISEPRAAAFYYYSRRHDAKIVEGSTIAVFDFGGGTLDVAVLTATDDWTFEVLRAGGDNALGGKNLDAAVSRWVERHLADENPGLAAWLRSPAGLDARRTLDDQIRRAKELLSEAPSATIRIVADGAQMTVTLTRDEFEQLIEPQITRGVRLAAQVLREAGVDRGGVQALFLTGGSSRIPYVHRRLAELGPIATLDDPKTVVAKGAAGFVAGGRATDPAALRAIEVFQREPAPPSRAPIPAPMVAGPPAPGPAPVPERSRTPLVVAGTALAMVLAAAGVYFLFDGGEAPAATSTVDTAAAAVGAPPATSDSTYVSEVPEDVLTLLPPKLITSSSSCDKSGFSFEGALQLRCVVTADSSVGKAMGLADGDDQWVTAWRDDQYARSNFIRYRDRTLPGYESRATSSGDRIVNYSTDDTYSSGFETVDRSTGLVLTFSVDSLDQGFTLSTELGFANR